MFGILKRRVPRKSTADVIREIHNSFDTAANNAVEYAKQILSIGLPPIKKPADIATLEKCGFSSVKMVTEHQAKMDEYYKKLKERENVEKRARIVQEWIVKYPQYKFIFTNQVTEICKQYNLVCGSVDRYKGDVPAKNIKEISAFKVKSEDTFYLEQYQDRYGDTSPREVDIFSTWQTYISEAGKKAAEAPFIREKTAFYPETWPEREIRINASERPISYKKVPLYICAPLSDMKADPSTRQNTGVFLYQWQ